MKKICLLLVGLLVFSSGISMGYVLNCPGTIYLGANQEITFSDCVNSSYIEVGDDYFMLSDMNFTFEGLSSSFCDYNLSFFNDTFDNHTYTVVPYRFFEFNCTYTNIATIDIIMDLPGDYFLVDLYVDNVLLHDNVEQGTSTYDFEWNNDGVSHRLCFYIDGYLPGCPTNASSTYDPNTQHVNLSWTGSSYVDSYVVVRNNASYPSSPTDGYEVQNSSYTFFNETLTTTGYFSVWAYNNSGYYSPNSCKLDLPWGAIVVYAVYNKSSPSQGISPFGILISNEAGTDTYWNSTATAPLYISKDNIPFGDNTIITINASKYKQSQYYYDFELNNFYNLSFYLSPTITETDEGTGDDESENYTTTRLYRIRVIDTFQNAISDVKVNVKFYANTTDTYDNTSILLTDGYGEADVYLVPNSNYKVFLTKSGYSQVGSKDWIPDPVFYGANYPKIFQMTVDSGEDITIWTGVNWSIEPLIYDYYDNFTMYFNITSENDDLEWFRAVVYLWNSNSETWETLYSETSTSSSGGSISYTTINGTGRYALECSFKREDYDSYNFGPPHSSEKYVFTIWPLGSPFDAGLTLDEAITGTVGASPVYVGDTVVAYSSLIGCFIAMIILFTFSPKFAGFAIIVLGIVIAAFKQPLGLIGDDVMNIGVAAMIIILGVITIYAMKKKG